MTATTHNPCNESRWASCLRENLTSSSYGEGLETDQASAKAPHQSLTRQLFFKWIKQHFRIKQFYGTTENAVKTQIWIAVSTYVLVAIVKKRLKIQASLYEMLQILSLTMFEQTPLDTLLSQIRGGQNDTDAPNQMNLFH